MDILNSVRGPQLKTNNRRNDFRFPGSSDSSQNSFVPPMQQYAPINNLLTTDVNSYSQVQGDNDVAYSYWNIICILKLMVTNYFTC